MNDVIKAALSVFPERLKIPLEKAVGKAPRIYEIRLVGEKSVYFYTCHGIRFVDNTGQVSTSPFKNPLVPLFSELDEITDRAIGYSGFSRENELRNGYITYGRACRLGFCCDTGDFSGNGKITSINIRIPCFSFAGEGIPLQELLSFDTGLLVAGAPSSGKTTLLRSIARYLSDGFSESFEKLCLIDERNEISAGVPLGLTTDIIRGMPKAQAILHAVRLLSPRYIICDEIGGEMETVSMLEGLNSGVSFIASMHAGSISSLIRRKQFRILFDENVFDKIIMLSSSSPGKIEAVYTYGEIYSEICRSYDTLSRNCNDRTIPFVFN